MRALVITLAIVVGTFSASACKKKDKKADKEPAPEPTPTQPVKKADPPAPKKAEAPKFDAYANEVLAALGGKDKAAFQALALTVDDLTPMFELAKKQCPDKVKKQLGDKSIDDAVKAMGKALGTKAERTKKYDEYLAACLKVADFSKAKLTKATPKDVKMECGGGRADNLVIEADVGGKPVFVSVDDPIMTKRGWRAPESITCSAKQP